ncbi:MAG: FapA family protein [Deltaproteobacteria bacterium]|nr:FapA family protein [Deltaproteobacteria bacterium]
MTTTPQFEIKITQSHVMVRVSADDQGRKPPISEIQKALKERGTTYRPEHLFDIVRRASGEFEPLTTRESTNYEADVEVIKDGQEAVLTLIPPQKGQAALNPALIKVAMQGAGVAAGILYNEIQRAVLEKLDNQPVVIARGKPMVQGRDGGLEILHPDQGPDLTAKRVNLRELNLVRSVAEGEAIALVTQPTRGEDGFDVFGHELIAKPGKAANFKLGRNVALSEDGQQIVSTAAGFIVTEGGKLSVEDVLRVDSVNAASGNVRFHGVINILGNVDDGFVVEGGQGVEILGTVGKATIKSKGNIVIRGGVMGSTLEAMGSVDARFISDGNVKAGTNVTSEEYIINTDVQAGHTIRVVKPPDGFISGGTLRAGDMVWTPNLGSEKAEVITEVEVGLGLSLSQQFDTLQITMERNQVTFDKFSKNLFLLQKERVAKGPLPDEKLSTFNRMLEAAVKARRDLHQSVGEFYELQSMVNESSDEKGIILVVNTAYPGVHITVRKYKVKLSNPLQGVAFKAAHGTVKPHPYEESLAIYKLQHEGKMPF